MPNAPATDKRKFCFLVHIEDISKAVKKFGQPSDVSFRESLIRAIEESTRDVALDEADYEAIAEEVAKNRRVREAKRRNK